MKKEKTRYISQKEKRGTQIIFGEKEWELENEKKRKTFEKSKKRHERKKEELLLTERGRD